MMKRFVRWILILLGGIVSLVTIGALTLLALVYVVAHWPFDWPSDAKSVGLFHRNRTEFVHLVDMVQEDRARGYIPQYPVRIDPSWGQPDNVNSQTKTMPIKSFQEYQATFSKLGLRYGLTVAGGDSVAFHIACVGVLVIGPCSYKGIIYRPDLRGASIVESLEDGKLPKAKGAVESGRYLLFLDSDWYVYRDEFD
jgi:hypothetical protein